MDNVSGSSLWSVILNRALPAEMAEELEIVLQDNFEKQRGAGRGVKIAILRSMLDGMYTVLRLKIYVMFEGPAEFELVGASSAGSKIEYLPSSLPVGFAVMIGQIWFILSLYSPFDAHFVVPIYFHIVETGCVCWLLFLCAERMVWAERWARKIAFRLEKFGPIIDAICIGSAVSLCVTIAIMAMVLFGIDVPAANEMLLLSTACATAKAFMFCRRSAAMRGAIEMFRRYEVDLLRYEDAVRRYEVGACGREDVVRQYEDIASQYEAVVAAITPFRP